MTDRMIQIPRGKIKRSVNAAIKRLHRTARRSPPGYTHAFARMVTDQRRRYARVKVVECADGFRLQYPGYSPGTGTGPFDTVEKAHAWFLSQGR
jgi:hypothetical protein